MKHLIFLVVLSAVSCQSNEEQGHSHTTGEHDNQQVSMIEITKRSDKTELFVEFPSLIVNQTAQFAAHFTMLENYQPLKTGAVTVSLIKDGKGIRNTVDEPLRAGIFTPSLQPIEAGTHQLVFEFNGSGYQDRIEMGDVQVFANQLDAQNNAVTTQDDQSQIRFTKEQAWQINFQVEPVFKGEIYQIINTSGTWLAAPGTTSTIIAKASGVVSFSMDKLINGTELKQGQLLMTIGSQGLSENNLQVELDKALANFEQARSEHERKLRLYELQIVPKAELEQVETKYRLAKSSYETLKSGYSPRGKEIRTPHSGYIKSVMVDNGGYVEQGAALLIMGTDQSRLLEALVSPTYTADLQAIQNIWYQPEPGKWSSLKESNGLIQSVGKKVDKDQPFVGVYAQVKEPVDLPEGSFTEVQIAFGQPRQSLLIPESALLEEYGTYSVIVQKSGESYINKPLQIGRRNGAMVEVLQGLEEGELVVTKGAYQVKMASLSGQIPAHGHEH